MFSIIVALSVALIVSIIAFFKGRTAWHWFALAMTAFTTIWFSSLVALRLASIESLDDADRTLGTFAGGTTAVVILIILLFVPKRLKLHSAAASGPRRSR